MVYNQYGKWYNFEENTHFSLKFKGFLETVEEQFDSIKADIPLPDDIYILSDLFAQNGTSLFAVGGVVRDFLYSYFHGGKFEPKDVDVATEAHPDKVENMLNSPFARSKGIRSYPKGKAFGVISAVFNNDPKREYEIATFREDGQYTDGRRPDSVSFSTPAKDAQRRDLTYNALFYDIHKKEIRDYNLNQNGQGQGIQDMKNLKASPPGNPQDRYREDKLRIPRLVRFFSRYNPGQILQHLDPEIIEAIKEFKDLAGVSPERISDEVIKGLKSAVNPVNYFKNYEAVGLLPAVFPGLNIDMKNIDRIGNNKNIKAILAWLLKDNNPQAIRLQLNRSKYSNDIADGVAFLLKLFNFDISKVAGMLHHRDLYKQLDPTPIMVNGKKTSLQMQGKESIEKDIMDFAKISGKEAELNHFLAYQPTVNSQNYMHLKGKDIGTAMQGDEANNYKRSWNGQNLVR